MTSPSSRFRLPRHALAGGAVLAALAAVVAAHEIPAVITAQAYVRPHGDTLTVLVRVPMRAMRDVGFPATAAGFLDLARADAALREAATLWIAGGIEVYENDARVGPPRLVDVRVSLPSDRSFASFEEALAHVSGPALPPGTTLVWNQGLLDARLEYRIASPTADFSVRLGLERLAVRVTTALRFVTADGRERAYELIGDEGVVRLDPRLHQAALRFVWLGFEHILDGADHLLFLLCLVIPFRRFRPLVLVVTAFTVAHSVTLIASAYELAPDALWFPPLVETLIAMSIVYMALENIVTAGSVRRRWIMTFAFGLVHGFGFSFALRERLQFAGSHLLTSLLSFNLGVEIGQLLVLALMVPALHGLFRYVVAERVGTIVLSALVAHTAWHWMVDRGYVLSQYEWPVMDAAFVASALWWAAAIVAAAGAIWAASQTLARQKTQARG